MNEAGAGCPRCDAPRLRSWNELDEAEREVVRRLPASAAYSPEERSHGHRWCVRCWHEETRDSTRET